MRYTRDRTDIRSIAAIGIAVAFALPSFNLASGQDAPPGSKASSVMTAEVHAAQEPPRETHGFLYGRVTTSDGATYQGRLRWGGNEEAFWDQYFNGFRDDNPWISDAPAEMLTERYPIELFGLHLANRNRKVNLGRPFMGRFGDIVQIEPKSRDILVTLKSGTVFTLDRFAADDLADGVRVWDDLRGVVDLDEWQIRLIEFLPTPKLADTPRRLHGTVTTDQGRFTGFIQWNRESGIATDHLSGIAAGSAMSVRFDAIRSIAKDGNDESQVTLLDGREISVSGTPDTGHQNRGVYVDDSRYGRVLVSWGAFDGLDLSPPGVGTGPAFDDFPPGLLITGSVTTRTGRRLSGRMVFDLDESETTETLDAPFQGVDYSIPFGLIASIQTRSSGLCSTSYVGVTLHSGLRLCLESEGDLYDRNPGMLIFADTHERPDFVPWSEVARIDVDRPLAMYPSPGPGAD